MLAFRRVPLHFALGPALCVAGACLLLSLRSAIAEARARDHRATHAHVVAAAAREKGSPKTRRRPLPSSAASSPAAALPASSSGSTTTTPPALRQGKRSARRNDGERSAAQGRAEHRVRAESPPPPAGRAGEKSELGHKVNATAIIEKLSFTNGEIPHAAAALERIKKDFSSCARSEQGPVETGGHVELRFIVRAAGRAEGVDAGRLRGVSLNIVRCMTSALALRSIGPPSADPVGVSATVRFTKD